MPPQLWTKGLKGLWSSNQLSTVFKKESLRVLGLNTQLKIAPWRHLAIAISREHLPKKYYFDRYHPLKDQIKEDIDN